MKRNLLLENLPQSICAVKAHGPTLVGIDGIDGPEKTTLASELRQFVEAKGRKVAQTSIDGFHHSFE
jgi:pantothenate kinase-related protein Tda10